MSNPVLSSLVTSLINAAKADKAAALALLAAQNVKFEALLPAIIREGLKNSIMADAVIAMLPLIEKQIPALEAEGFDYLMTALLAAALKL